MSLPWTKLQLLKVLDDVFILGEVMKPQVTRSCLYLGCALSRMIVFGCEGPYPIILWAFKNVLSMLLSIHDVR